MKIKRKNKEVVKPNMIPILDAIFIFIFFLLMSAQFLEIYEIGSDAPAVKTVNDDDKDKKPPLNLTLEVTKKKITIKTGLDGNIVKTLPLVGGDYNYKELSSKLIEIKKKHINETSIVIKPSSNVQYKRLVWIMDTVSRLEKESPTLIAKNDQGKTIETRILFDQIIFETII